MMEEEIREVREIMRRILHRPSLQDPLSKKDVYRLLVIYKGLHLRGEYYLEWCWTALKQAFSPPELELLHALHQALVYRVGEDEDRLQARTEQRTREVLSFLEKLEEELNSEGDQDSSFIDQGR